MSEVQILFERMIVEHEEELFSLKEENERQRRLLDAVFNPEVRIQRADVQQLLVVKEEVPPEQQDWSSSLDQEDPEPPHIKDEQEELWTSQAGEQLQGLEEAGIKFSFTPVKTEDDGADCGGSEPDRMSDPERHPGPDTDETEDLSEPETDDSRDWVETQEPQSDLNPLQNNEVPVNCSTGNTSSSLPEFAGSSDHKVRLRPIRSKTLVEPFSSVCGDTFSQQTHLNSQMIVLTGVKAFGSGCIPFPYMSTLNDCVTIFKGKIGFKCPVCGKIFTRKENLKNHINVHTREEVFSCSVCEKTFTNKKYLTQHMAVHKEWKACSCSVCGQTFAHKGILKNHMTVHPGWKACSCSVCGQTFAHKGILKNHMAVHTEWKACSCSVCGQTFAHKDILKIHMVLHPELKPFSCSVCHKRFALEKYVAKHSRVHIGVKKKLVYVTQQ